MHKIWRAKIAHYHYLAKKLAIYHCFENMQGLIAFLKLEYVKLEFTVKLEFFEKIYFKFFGKFFMILEFMKLEYHKKFSKFFRGTQVS